MCAPRARPRSARAGGPSRRPAADVTSTLPGCRSYRVEVELTPARESWAMQADGSYVPRWTSEDRGYAQQALIDLAAKRQTSAGHLRNLGCGPAAQKSGAAGSK